MKDPKAEVSATRGQLILTFISISSQGCCPLLIHSCMCPGPFLHSLSFLCSSSSLRVSTWDSNELWFRTSSSWHIWGVSLVPPAGSVSALSVKSLSATIGVSTLDSWRSQSHGYVPLSAGVCTADTLFFLKTKL